VAQAELAAALAGTGALLATFGSLASEIA
jgi:hypothetical protein